MDAWSAAQRSDAPPRPPPPPMSPTPTGAPALPSPRHHARSSIQADLHRRSNSHGMQPTVEAPSGSPATATDTHATTALPGYLPPHQIRAEPRDKSLCTRTAVSQSASLRLSAELPLNQSRAAVTVDAVRSSRRHASDGRTCPSRLSLTPCFGADAPELSAASGTRCMTVHEVELRDDGPNHADCGHGQGDRCARRRATAWTWRVRTLSIRDS